MKRIAVLAAPLILSACALPPALTVASYLADGVSLATSGKSLGDHALSIATAKDCAVLRIVRGKAVCHEFAPGEKPEMVAEAQRWAEGGEIVGQDDYTVAAPVMVASAAPAAKSPAAGDPLLIPQIAGLDISFAPIAKTADTPSGVTTAFSDPWRTPSVKRSEQVGMPPALLARWEDPRPRRTTAASRPEVSPSAASAEEARAAETERVTVIGSFLDRDNAVAAAARWPDAAPEIVAARVRGATFYRVVIATARALPDEGRLVRTSASWRAPICGSDSNASEYRRDGACIRL